MDGEFRLIYDSLRPLLILPRAMSQDEALYPNPEVFHPERFLNPDGTLNDDKVDYAFGYGRRHVPFTRHILNTYYSHRICPGKHMADSLVSRCNRNNYFFFHLTGVVNDGFGAVGLQHLQSKGRERI